MVILFYYIIYFLYIIIIPYHSVIFLFILKTTGLPGEWGEGIIGLIMLVELTVSKGGCFHDQEAWPSRPLCFSRPPGREFLVDVAWSGVIKHTITW